MGSNGDGEHWRKGDGVTRRRGDGGHWRKGDGATGRMRTLNFA